MAIAHHNSVCQQCVCVCAFMRSCVPMLRVALRKSFSDCLTFDICSLGSEWVWDDRFSVLAARMLFHLPMSCLFVALPSGPQDSRPKSGVLRHSCLNLDQGMMFETWFLHRVSQIIRCAVLSLLHHGIVLYVLWCCFLL